MSAVHFILYVSDQSRSAKFYEFVLGLRPRLDVPGMTEFELRNGTILGLMPEAGIQRLLGEAISDPKKASGIPRAELYIVAENPEVFHERALESGGRELSPLALRSWGHWAAYSSDPDGHVLAFAKTT